MLIDEKYVKSAFYYGSYSFVQEVNQYEGQERAHIACTQLREHRETNKRYSERDKKRILVEWVDFLKSNPKQFKALHFNSRVPQVLFDAACHQENLEELRFKWAYTKIYPHLKI